jgi:hypothetical protein
MDDFQIFVKPVGAIWIAAVNGVNAGIGTTAVPILFE